MSSQDSFAKMHQSVIKDKRINDKDFRILAFIKSFTDTWKVHQSHIARELGISSSTVIRSIDRLDAAGYLTYDRKPTVNGSERRNVKMLHKPSHWDTVQPPKHPPKTTRANPKTTAPPFKSDTQPMSDMKDTPVKDDNPPPSDLTDNEELTQTSYAESATKSHDAEPNGEINSEVISALWMKYNAVPDGYIQIDPMKLNEDDRYLALRMFEDLQDVKAGLRQKHDQTNQHNLDAHYYEKLVREELDGREHGLILPPKIFILMVENAATVFVNAQLASMRYANRNG
jgi:DNA-binding Lrp family transcriptional regulator